MWLILNDVPEWRWQLDINYSHWYPSMTIFRCKKKDDWKSVFAEILNELKKKAKFTIGIEFVHKCTSICLS